MARPPRPSSSSPFSGKTLGRCRIGRPIGRGATATVFHAAYLPLKRDVAVKILRPDAAASEEARTRFIEEARSLAKLDHANVVKVFDVVEDGGLLLIIMDFVPGRNLRQVVEEDGFLDPEAALQAVRQIADALDHAHGQGILHRDVKPANVIVDDDGRAVLVDFGNADLVGEAADRKGTARYVAPEVFQGKRQDEKTDTYSLGATLFHLLAGVPPHDGATVQEILKAVESGRVRAPSQVNPDAGIPRELDQMVKRSMAPARGYRFLAREFTAAVDEVLPAVLGAPGRTRPRRTRGRSGSRTGARTGVGRAPQGPNLALWVVIGLLLVGTGAAAMLANRGEPPPPPPPPEKGEAEAPAGTGPAEGDGHIDPGFDQRASGRAAREAAGEEAFRSAELFAASNAPSDKEKAERFAAVASEYADLSSGRRAREQEKLWAERALSVEERATRAAELAAISRREKEIREEALEACREHVAGMRFAEALSALDQASPAGSQAEDWKRRRERLNFLIGFAGAIGTDLEGRPVPVQDVRYNFGKYGEKVVHADEEGLSLSGTGGTRPVPWAELQPADVVSLCRRIMRTSGEHRLLLAVFCWETGLKKEAREEMDNALLTDRTGTVYGRLEELFGPEDERR